jgi:hypothetical protein
MKALLVCEGGGAGGCCTSGSVAVCRSACVVGCVVAVAGGGPLSPSVTLAPRRKHGFGLGYVGYVTEFAVAHCCK